MRLLAGLLTGAFVCLALATLTGWRVHPLRRPARRRSRQRHEWLVQADSQLTWPQFVVGSALTGMLAFGLVSVVTDAPAVAVVPAIAVGLTPRAWFARRRAARLREVTEAWPDGIRSLVASISAGLSLNQSLIALSRSGPQPLRRAFAGYPSLTRTVGVVPALEVVKEQLADPTSDRVIEVLVLAHERGGHTLTAILRDLADATTKDVRVREEIATHALEQKLNARAVFVLPWLVLLVLTLQPGHFRVFYRSPAGLAVVAVGGAASLLGLWLVTRLGRDPDEQRVFGPPDPLPGGGP